MYNKHDLKYLRLAFEESEKSVARRLKVGCVIVKDSMIISKGYNHMPSFMDPDPEIEYDDHSLVTKPELIHAEQWAIVGIKKKHLTEATLYVTDSPCISCAKLIYQVGIDRVVYSRPYRITDGIDFLKSAGITILQIPFNLIS